MDEMEEGMCVGRNRDAGKIKDTDLGWEERGLNSSSSSAEEGEKFFITNPAVEQKKEECDELHAQIPLPDPALGEYTWLTLHLLTLHLYGPGKTPESGRVKVRGGRSYLA
ncbi:hypothetical protein O3P69_000332 [Scylla paramamosain]|uniref:Uncharacterized protein n=1 Tax=Scylla paramamosain TaxID=85552 RepID=A0AAW0UVY2_SCYPA